MTPVTQATRLPVRDYIVHANGATLNVRAASQQEAKGRLGVEGFVHSGAKRLTGCPDCARALAAEAVTR